MNTTEIRPLWPNDYESVAQTYAQVFAGEPWKEVSKCDACGAFSAAQPTEAVLCNCGGIFAQEAYPLADTTAYVEKETTRTGGQSLVVAQLEILQASVAGFAWGFELDASAFAEQKYRTQEMQQLICDLLVQAGFFYYISEVGVLPTLQGQGFGKKLTQRLVGQAERAGYQQFVVRTNEDSAMRYILESMGMQPILGLQTGIQDTENEARVVFVAGN